MQKAKVRENVKEYALLTLGTVIMTIGIYFFKFPPNKHAGIVCKRHQLNRENGSRVEDPCRDSVPAGVQRQRLWRLPTKGSCNSCRRQKYGKM